MLFYLLVTRISSEKLNVWVAALTIAAAISYLFYPFFVNRLVMYFAIWWVGVKFATTYLNQEKYSLRAYLPYAGVLLTITAILALNLYLNRAVIDTYQFKYSAYPIIEFRHFAFALIVMIAAIVWQNQKWFGFDYIFGVFKYLAPCSYVIYISHSYLVVHATYLSFLNRPVLEFIIYLVVMIAFAFFVEVFFYNKIRKLILG